ncbi:ATP-binding protein [Kineococcus sp. R8]|uniref:ATP-binding protein n=1 Tax=Kineococcus siccus TaxID=2696567 RepID=UPI0014136C5E|nr:ATP-binding protein [Kineococcus siccus]
MPTIALRFSPLAEHVRTARLVAVSVARRAGFEEGQLDEIRIAIGEACARAVGRTTVDGLVDMHLCDDGARLEVVVVERGADGAVLPVTGVGEDPLALALLQGMADDVSVAGSTVPADGPREGVRMAWSLQEAAPVTTPGFGSAPQQRQRT